MIMKKMFDIYEHDKDRHVNYLISVSRYWDRAYVFGIYKREVESWYKGEDSGARYPEYGDFEVVELYDLTPILYKMISGKTIKQFVDKIFEEWPPNAGELYTPRETHQLYYYLDNYIDIEKLRINDISYLLKYEPQ